MRHGKKRFTQPEPVLAKAHAEPTKAELAVYLSRRLVEDLARQRNIMKEWVDKFMANDFYGALNRLSWSREVWAAAARLELLIELEAVVKEKTWAVLPEVHIGWGLRLAQKANSLTNKSSSQTSNMAEEYMLEALAKLADPSYFGGQYSAKQWLEAPDDAEAAEAGRVAKQLRYNQEFMTKHAEWVAAKAAFKAEQAA